MLSLAVGSHKAEKILVQISDFSFGGGWVNLIDWAFIC